MGMFSKKALEELEILSAIAMSLPDISPDRRRVSFKKRELSKKQKKARAASKRARKSRRKNRK